MQELCKFISFELRYFAQLYIPIGAYRYFGEHSEADLFLNRQDISHRAHHRGHLFPNGHYGATGEHQDAKTSPNRHQKAKRAQNRKIVCPFVYLTAFSISSSTFRKSSGFSSNFMSSTFMMSFLPSLYPSIHSSYLSFKPSR